MKQLHQSPLGSFVQRRKICGLFLAIIHWPCLHKWQMLVLYATYLQDVYKYPTFPGFVLLFAIVEAFFSFFFLFYLSFVSKGLYSKILYSLPESFVYREKEVGTYKKGTFCSLMILLLCTKSVLLTLHKDKVSKHLLEFIHLLIFYHPRSMHHFITKTDRPSF